MGLPPIIPWQGSSRHTLQHPHTSALLGVGFCHFRGQAALKALELRSRLRRAPVPVPPALLRAYPELRQIAAPAPKGWRMTGGCRMVRSARGRPAALSWHPGRSCAPDLE